MLGGQSLIKHYVNNREYHDQTSQPCLGLQLLPWYKEAWHIRVKSIIHLTKMPTVHLHFIIFSEEP